MGSQRRKGIFREGSTKRLEEKACLVSNQLGKGNDVRR